MSIEDFAAMRRKAQELGPKRVAVVVAEDEVSLAAIAGAVECGIAEAVLIGDERRIRALLAALRLHQLADEAEFVQASTSVEAATRAAVLARDGEAEILLKGHLRTDELLHALLDKQHGLRMGRLLSDVLLYEDTLSGRRRLVAITDGAVNVLPTLEQKKQIILNAAAVMQRLCSRSPRMALMSATEVVCDKLPSTIEAFALTQWAGGLGNCEVFGPLALDNALLRCAAEAKGIVSAVAGNADVMVVPNIEAGNLLGKAVKYFGGSQCAHVAVGAKVPVLIPSRVESLDDKLNSIALGVIVHGA
jgi:phosphate butyryltransferase